jgi:probable F420-dependent oxidoreductase
MDLGLFGIWTHQFDQQPINAAREAAAELEELGYGALWLGEGAGREAMAQAAIMLAATRRTVLATGVASSYARDAVTMAAGARTLAEAFPDRFVLGLGISYPGVVEDIRGHHFGPPLATMRDYLDAMDAAPFGPPPVDPPRREAPRVLGTTGRRMLELAGQRCAGAFPLGMPVEFTAKAREILGPDALLAVTQAAVLDSRADRARETASGRLAEFLPNRRRPLAELGFRAADLADPTSRLLTDALIAAGDADHIRHRMREHLDAGANHVALHILATDENTLPWQQWRELAWQRPASGQPAGSGQIG